jgi:hypothetical protein
MSKHLDEQVAAFRNRPLSAGPYAFVRVDAIDVATCEDGAGWLAFLRSLHRAVRTRLWHGGRTSRGALPTSAGGCVSTHRSPGRQAGPPRQGH